RHRHHAGDHAVRLPVPVGHRTARTRGEGMKRRRFDSLVVYGVFYIIFLYAPVALLPMFSFNDSIYIAFPLKDFTFKWYEQMVSNDSLLRALYNSLKVGVPVSIISTILGLLAAKAVTRYRVPGRGPLMSTIMLPL